MEQHDEENPAKECSPVHQPQATPQAIKDTLIFDDPSDEELENILDSALDDFDSSAQNTPVVTNSTSDGTRPKVTSSSGPTGGAATQNPNKMPEEEMLQTLLSGLSVGPGGDELEKHVMSLLQDDPAAQAEFEKLSQTGVGAAAQSQKEFADTLAETMSSLSKNAESLQSGGMSEEELMKTFEQSLNLGGATGGGDGQGDFIPMMQNMMQNLLSKDVLYPSLKDLATKYPAWLSEHEGKISRSEFHNHSKQFIIVSDLVQEYDQEKSDDTQQQKDARFERILDLMTKMQDCGPPPKEIIGELAPGLNFDKDGNPMLPGMDQQCSIM